MDRSRLIAAVAFGTVGCADPMTRADLLQRIESGTAPIIVDVRSRREYEESHVPGAVHVPFYSILAKREGIPAPLTAAEALVLYCEHGPRAGIARAQLWLSGVGPVLFLEGHMTAWKRDGLPVETEATDLERKRR